MNVPDPLLVLVAVVCLGLAGMLSAGEAAVLRVTRASLLDALAEAEADDERPDQARAARVGRIRRAQALAVDPTAAVASFALVRVFAQTVGLAAAALLLADWLRAWWPVLVATAVVGLAAGVLSVRVSPRTLGFRRPTRVLLALAGPLTVVHRAAAWITRRSAARATDAPVSEEELREMADRVRENEAIEAEERELIRSVFELGATLAREIMVPRTDMVTADAGTPLRKVMRLFLKSGYSRVPVVGRSVDDLLGVAYLKDVARVLENDPGAGDRPVSEVARPAVFVPESKPVDDLLREMQASRSHIAVVIDEYGGTAGLVTVEDVIEELVGELTDEHDTVHEPEPEHLGDGTYRVPARLPVDELGELFDLRLEDDDVDTAGGLLAKAIGKVPLVGSTADVGGLHLVGERVQGRRKQLATLLVSRTLPEAADDSVVPQDQKEHHA
jgi:CBS domain containing-hemolysin-like protein